jgi:hypothetical protein
MSGNQPTGEKMEIAKRIEIAKKLEELEKDVQDLKTLILSEKNESLEKELISLRGIGKALFSEKELDEAIEKAKKSLFYGVENVVLHEIADTWKDKSFSHFFAKLSIALTITIHWGRVHSNSLTSLMPSETILECCSLMRSITLTFTPSLGLEWEHRIT